MSDYPSETEIRRILRPHAWTMWVVAFVLLGSGLFLELSGTMANAFVRAGGVVVLWSVGYNFWLERNEFLTGHAGAMFDSGNHVVPKGIWAKHLTLSTILGSFVGIFGDLISPEIEKMVDMVC